MLALSILEPAGLVEGMNKRVSEVEWCSIPAAPDLDLKQERRGVKKTSGTANDSLHIISFFFFLSSVNWLKLYTTNFILMSALSNMYLTPQKLSSSRCAVKCVILPVLSSEGLLL